MKHMLFWGATGQAKVLRECMKYTGMQLVALFDNNPALVSPFADVTLYTGRAEFERWLAAQRPEVPVGFLVAIGGDRGKQRVEIQAYLEAAGLVPLTARHETAFVSADAVIGAGSQILARASVCVEVVMGQGCIINTMASVDHECRLGDGVHVCPGARVAGCVEIADYATIGTGAVIIPRLTIGEGAVVGAGAVVIHDVSPYSVVAGNPARLIRQKDKNDTA